MVETCFTAKGERTERKQEALVRRHAAAKNYYSPSVLSAPPKRDKERGSAQTKLKQGGVWR